jgi:hypothetical protein
MKEHNLIHNYSIKKQIKNKNSFIGVINENLFVV